MPTCFVPICQQNGLRPPAFTDRGQVNGLQLAGSCRTMTCIIVFLLQANGYLLANWERKVTSHLHSKVQLNAEL